MKLRRIKLAGFKSFVEPTTIPLPSGITAVVGPNGCGKSNLVDAIRWVLGEGSAKHLRGGHMSDFLFNGTESRAPVSRATAELVFDNAEGAMGGPYAAYEEISVKRAMDRDGGSDYFLNGGRCRRKDITDLFLGTGLGPRAYAIIEQGMITRLIEARPQDRRVLVEEAAGVTRYKERRKETSRRIEQTRENLARVEDLRGELGERLQRLEDQADRAREYKGLKDRQRALDRQLLGARYRQRGRQRDTDEGEVRRLETELEAARSEATQAEAEVERCRVTYEEANEAVNQAQGRYYARESEIAGLEREQSHAREERERLQGERDSAQAEIEEIEQRLAEHQQRIEEAGAEEEELRQEAERLEGLQRQAEADLEEARQRVTAAEEAEAAARGAIQAPAQEASLQQERRQQAQDRRAAIDQRLAAIDAELAELEAEAPDSDLEAIRARQDDAERARQKAAAELEAAEAEQRQREGERDRAAESLAECRQERQRIAAHLESLQSLEARAADLDAGGQALLEELGHDRGRLLGGRIRVEPGWEAAVEAALGERLQALVAEADEWQPWLAWMRTREGGRFPAIRRGETGGGEGQAESELLARIECEPELRPVLAEWLAGIGTATDLETAQARVEALGAGACLITPEGHRVGRGWAVIHHRQGDSGVGWLQRRREIEELEGRLAETDRRLAQAETEAQRADEALASARARVASAREGVTEAEDTLQQVREEAGQRQADRDRLQERRRHLEAERERLVSEREEQQAARERAAAAADQAGQRKEAAEADWQARRQELDESREAFRAAESREREARESLNGVRTRLDSRKAAREEAERHTQWARDELAKRRQRLEEVATRLADSGDNGEDSDIEARLEAALQGRSEAEGELRERQNAAEQAQAALAQAQERRSSAEADVEARRNALEEARQALSKTETQVEELEARMDEIGAKSGQLLAETPEEADPGALEAERTELQRSLDALGAVNLAAIDEYEEVAQRKAHLDEQARDLEEALTTLEGAIRRIDSESRALFRETFEAVDEHFRQLFPTLFGGGRAYLQMTEDDPLETGVEVMAQPPGKKIHSIHLLSGGEKALSAVALTFALFRLNPAPFCVLDEVDAPLDDANVGRFGRLLQEMAETTQFVVITHNRTTMQVADQLVGVTMAEPGVSRVVAVSVEEGARMVEEAGPAS